MGQDHLSTAIGVDPITVLKQISIKDDIAVIVDQPRFSPCRKHGIGISDGIIGHGNIDMATTLTVCSVETPGIGNFNEGQVGQRFQLVELLTDFGFEEGRDGLDRLAFAYRQRRAGV